MNTQTVIGNVAADPELRYAPNGKAIVKFSVADTPRRLNPATQKWEEGETNWFRVVAFDDLAKHIAASLKKGDQTIVIGQIRTSSYVDRDNQNRTSQELHATHVGPSLQFATATVERQRRNGGSYEAPANTPSTVPDQTPVDAGDDVPF